MDIGYLKVKRDRVSQCNLCLRQAELSWDHVPPKGGIGLSRVEQQTVFQKLVDPSQGRRFTESQNGVKYRTLCRSCNSAWLGGKCDPVLNDFATRVGRVLDSTLELPPVIHVPTRPAAVMRAVLGHLVAAKADIDDCVFDEEVRSFFFDERASVPDWIHVFYWVYPYSSIVVARDLVMPAVRGKFGKVGLMSVLKYFPIAFLATDADTYEGLRELTAFRGLGVNDVSDVPIGLRDVRDPDWPETVEDGNPVFGGAALRSSVHAVPREAPSR